MKRTIFLVAMMGCAAFAYACSGGDNTPTDGGADGGEDVTTQDVVAQDVATQDSGTQDSATQDSSTDATTGDAGGDGGAVNGCTTFTDFTADGGTIVGPTGNAPQQYNPNCVKIKAGQSVTWTSKFSAHPLEPLGGTTPTPITLTSSGTSVTFTFPNAGTYGFACQVHPTIMFGAVQVQ